MSRPPSRSLLLSRDLLRRIVRRDLRPGDPIDVQAIGRRHGVSRTVVREALAELSGKGLIHTRAKVGTAVAPESGWHCLDPAWLALAISEAGGERTLAEAIVLRRLIEPVIAADAAGGASSETRATVLAMLRKAADAVGADDTEGFVQAALGLHAALAQASANRLLRTVHHALDTVRAAQWRRLAAAHDPDHPGRSALGRALLLQTGLGLAVVRRDADRAAQQARALASYNPVAMPARSPSTTPAVADEDEWPQTTTLITPTPPLTARSRANL